MRKAQIDLVGPFYTDEALSWSQQDTVNYIPVRAEVAGTWTPTKLVDAPGLRPWVWIGNYSSGVSSAPIRGLHDVEGQLFAVCGQTLYLISNAGVAIPLGSIPGIGRVSMAHNQVAGGHQLTVVNGTGGYVWNTATQTFTIITDEGFPGSSRVDFIDGYMMHVEPFGRFLLHSDLADALNFNTLDRFEAETQPDRTRSLIVNNQEVWAFGDRTIDVFANAGTAQGTFQNKGVSISVGCIAGASPAIVDNGVAWLGHDRVVYHARGYSPTRISTRAIDVALSKLSLTDIRNAFSFVFEDRGHAIYYLTIPNGPTFGYDFSTGLWHRRASWHPERDISGRWRLSDLVRSNGRWVGADYQTGKLYLLDWDYMLEGCDPLVRERVSPVAHNNGNRFTIDEIELQFETGGPETECIEFPVQPEGPSIEGAAPNGTVGIAYAGYTYTITEGDSPIASIEIISGAIPGGLTFDEGVIDTATPEDVGDYTFTIRVTDTAGLFADLTDTIRIALPLMAFGYDNQFMLIESDWTGVWQSGGDALLRVGTAYAVPLPGYGAWFWAYNSGRYSNDLGQTWEQSGGDGIGGSGGTRLPGSWEGVLVVPGNIGGIDRSIDAAVTMETLDGTSGYRALAPIVIDGELLWVGYDSGDFKVSNDNCETFGSAVHSDSDFSFGPYGQFYDGEKIIFCGEDDGGNSKVVTTTDAATFTAEIITGATGRASVVCEHDGVIVVGNRNGQLCRKVNGEWSVVRTEAGYWWRGLEHNGIEFVAIGSTESASPPRTGLILSSVDGLDWTVRVSASELGDGDDWGPLIVLKP